MRHIIQFIDRVLFSGAVLGVVATFLLSLMLIVEVITTSFFNWSQPWAIEYSGYLLAVILFAGSGWALSERAHIQVSVVTARLGLRSRWALEVVTTGMACGLAGFMAMVTAQNAWRSFILGSTSLYASRTPLCIPQGLLALSMALLALGFINRLLKLVSAGTAAVPAVAVAPMEAV